MNTVLRAACDLHDEIRTAVPEMHSQRRLTPELVAGMRTAGVFDMALPQSLGGPGLNPVEQFEVIETLTLSDASVGWCTMIGADSGYLPGYLDDATFTELYPTRNLVTAGKVMPTGKAVRCSGGWRVTGRWDFGSGSSHADRFLGGVVLHNEDGTLVLAPMDVPRCGSRSCHVSRSPCTTPGTRLACAPRRRTTTKSSTQLSPEHWLYDVFGPMRRPDEPLYRAPIWFVVKHSGIVTGLARRAIDEAVTASESKMLMPERTLLIDRPGTLEVVARAEAATRSARAFLVDEIERVWQACVDDGDLSREATAPMRLAMVHASSVALDVTRAMFDLLTTTSITSDSVFAQLVADAAVANTHVAVSHRSWDPLGARLTGRPVVGQTVFI